MYKAQKKGMFITFVAGIALYVIVSLAIGIIAGLSVAPNGLASAKLQTIDAQFGNKTFQLSYNMTNGGSVDSANADSNQPYGGSLQMYITSPEDGVLEVAIPRELFDLVGFTDHFADGFELGALVDEYDFVPMEVSAVSCDKIILHIPVEARSEQIDIVTTDILGVHGHPYPPALHITEKIEADRSEFNVHMWTTAMKCDISFSKEEKKLHVDIEGRNQTSGGELFIAIPPQLLGGNYTVLVDGQKVNFTEQQPYIENTGSSSDNFVLTRLGLQYPAGAKTIDVIGTSVLDPHSAFEALFFLQNVHGRGYIIDGKAQAGIEVINSTILPNRGIYIDLNATQDGVMELTLPKTVIEDVMVVEVGNSDVLEVVSFDIIEENEVHTTISFKVVDGARQATIKGAGGIVPEFGSVAIVIGGVSISSVILAHRYVKRKWYSQS